MGVEGVDFRNRRDLAGPAGGGRKRASGHECPCVTVGERKGALFDGGGPGALLCLAEGEVSALALRWLQPDCRCMAAGGTAGMAALSPDMLPEAASVTIEADGDALGAAVVWRTSDNDPADEWAESIGKSWEIERWRVNGATRPR